MKAIVRHVSMSCFALVCGALAGCTFLITEPTGPLSTVRANGLNYGEGLAFLDSSRTAMVEQRAKIDRLNQVMGGAVAGSVGAAAVNALTRGPSDVMLGLLIIGGGAYSFNQTSSLSTQSDIYGEGIKTLDCIDRAGAKVHHQSSTVRQHLLALQPRLDKSIFELAAALDNARRMSPFKPGVPALLAMGDGALVNATQLSHSIRAYVDATDVGTAIYYATRSTVTAVNNQLRSKAPSLAEIAKAGSTLTTFVATNIALGSDAASARTAVKALNLTQGSHTAADDINTKIGQLEHMVVQIQPILPPPGYEKAEIMETCQAALPGVMPFRARPPGPVALIAGGESHQITVDADALPLSHGFRGLVPSLQQILISHPSDKTYLLAAPEGAQAGKYFMYIAQRDGRVLPDIEILVTARSGVVANSIQRREQRPDTGVLMSFLQKRALIGLSEDVKNETDQAFRNRVMKLENCFGLASSGGWSDKLNKELGKNLPVNTAGDCPKPKQPVNPIPIPKPPPIPQPPGSAPQPAKPPSS